MAKTLRFLFALLLPAVALAQPITSLPRVTSTTGLNDSTLHACMDSARVTAKACSLTQYRKGLSLKAFDSLLTTNLNLTGGTVRGAPTWLSTQGMTISGSAATLTNSRTFWGLSFNGSANVTGRPQFTSGWSSNGRDSLLAGSSLVFGATDTVYGQPVWNATQTFASGQTVDSATGAARSPAGTLTGNTLAAGVAFSSLTTTGTLQNLHTTGDIVMTSGTWIKQGSAFMLFGDGTITALRGGSTTGATIQSSDGLNNNAIFKNSGGLTLRKGRDSLLAGSALAFAANDTVYGQPVWNATQTFATGQVVDSATGANRAQALTTSRTFWGLSFNGSANVTGKPAFASAWTSTGRDSLLAGSALAFAANDTVYGQPVWNATQTFATGQKVDTATLAKNLTGSPAITVSSCTGCGGGVGGATVSDTVRAVTFDSVKATKFWAGDGTAAAPSKSFLNSRGLGLYRFGADTLGFSTLGVHSLRLSGGASALIAGGAGSMTLQAGTGASRTLTLQSTTSGSTAKNTLVLGADTSVTAIGQFLGNTGCGSGAFGYGFTGRTANNLCSNGASQIDLQVGSTRRFQADTSACLTNVLPTCNTGGKGTIWETPSLIDLNIRSGNNAAGSYLYLSSSNGTAGAYQNLLTLGIDSSVLVNGALQFQRKVAIPASVTDGFYLSGADTLAVVTGGALGTRWTGGSNVKMMGGPGSFTLLAGTGNSRTLTLQTTTSAGTAKNSLVLGADTSVTAIGQVLAMTGSQTAPSVSFSASTGLGMYRAGVDTIGFSAAGSYVAAIDKGGNIRAGNAFRAPNNTAGIPGFSFVNDTISGVYRHAIDTVGISTHGIARLLIANMAATGVGDVNLCWTTNKVLTQGAACGSSTRKIKTDIGLIPADVALDWTMRLKPTFFTYKPGYYGGRKDAGFIAEEVANIDARLAMYAQQPQTLKDGTVVQDSSPININERAILAAVTATVQQQQRVIVALQARLDKMCEAGVKGACP